MDKSNTKPPIAPLDIDQYVFNERKRISVTLTRIDFIVTLIIFIMIYMIVLIPATFIVFGILNLFVLTALALIIITLVIIHADNAKDLKLVEDWYMERRKKESKWNLERTRK